MFGNNGQLSRDERVQLYGIDCDDQIVWHEWTPGIESVHNLELQNVALVTQKLKFKLPPTKEFDMPYPEPFKLAPGMKKSIPISFRPSKYEPHVDQVEILTKGGTFFVTVKAVVKDISVTIPHFIDFGLRPTNEVSEVPIDVYNTGTLCATLKWHAKPPFVVKCPVEKLDVGEMLRCMVGFEPQTASVFDAELMCEASQSVDTLAVDEESLSGVKESSSSKKYRMEATGVGKVPHLCVPQPFKPVVEFGHVFPGNRPTQQLRIVNMTPVRASFKVRAVTDSGEVVPLQPLPFSVSPDSGVVEPNMPFSLTFTFQSHTAKEFACQRFQITTSGGVPLTVTCTGFCRPMEVHLSTRSVQFGEVKCGKPYSRTLQLHNESDRPAVYHFMNADNLRGVFWFDRYMGSIPANSFQVVTAYFGPLAPLNYHKRVYCVVKGAISPIALDLIGSAHTDKSRPARLEQYHIDLFRQMQLNGVREHPPPAENPPPPEERMEEDDGMPEPVQTLDTLQNGPSATANFLEMMLPMDSKLRDITTTPVDIDFGSCSAGMMSDKQVITLTNRTSQKVCIAWMIPGETRLPCTADEKALFTVYPVQCDLRPKSSADFTVSFRPQNDCNYEGEILEAVVYQKVNRSFRLVDTKRFTPPWMLSLRGMGHTMGITRNDPRLDISETNIRFRACYPGQRTYQIATLTNPGDTCIAYRVLPPVDATGGDVIAGSFADLKEDVPFRAWPTQGVIAPHQFHLLVLEFAPMMVRNEKPFAANFPIVVDYNDSHPKHLHVAGRSWAPKLTFCRGQPTATFPPTCSGIASMMMCDIKNVSEIPISFQCQIPSRFRSNFWFPNSMGSLAPSDSQGIAAHFCPSSENTFSAPMYCVARALEDPDNFVEGPLKSLMMSENLDVSEPAPQYVLQFVGHGKKSALSVDPEFLDLGAVKASETVCIGSNASSNLNGLSSSRRKGSAREQAVKPVMILNSSNLTVHYTVTFEFLEKPDLPKEVGMKALELGATTGSVAGRCTETFDLTFSPPCRGIYEYRISITPREAQGGSAAVLSLRADVQYPYVQIADLRTESSTLQPQSMMWTQFQVDGINEHYQGEITEVEQRFQAAIGIDEKKQLVKQLKMFQLLFGTSAVGSPPTVVYVVLSNPGRLPMRFSFQTPKNLNLENPPYWCDEKSMVDEREAHFGWVEEHNIYDIEPRSGEIAAGDFLHVKLTYHHSAIGPYILPVVFNVLEGRSVLFYFKAHTVAPNVGCLSVRSSVVPLQPVPLNAVEGPMQPVELTNSGSVAAHWRVDKQSLFEFNMKNYDFDILKVHPAEGVLEATSSTNLHFFFTPLEARNYVCPVRIEMLKDGRPAEELCFELRADGYDPAGPKVQADPYFPPNLPIQTYAPIPGCGAALSIEILDFEQCPLRAQVSRMLVLVNYSSEYVLKYTWDHRELMTLESELQIEPSSGELSPGSHCIIVFRICCAKPVNISGEVACHLEWTHLSSHGHRPELDSREENAPRVEYHAFHSDHVHEPMRTGKSFLAGHEQQHISVANRLTVSRFRHLMSTAAGQKFLNENLHRTALLASHIQTMSPRKAMQQNSTQSRISAGGASGTTGDSVDSYSTPPTNYPLYVRIRAVVADWEVQSEGRSDFLVADPLSIPDITFHDEDQAEKLRTRAAIRGDSRISSKASKAVMPDGGLNRKLVQGTLEFLIREVIEEKSFAELVDGMLAQDDPFFVQYEDSPPPGEPDHAKDAATSSALRSVPTITAEGGFEELKALLDNRPKPSWTSELLGDFPEPALPDFEAITGDSQATSSSDKQGEPTVQVPPSPGATSEAPATPSQALLDQAMTEHGEVDLEAFKTSAGDVLDSVLLDVMDDVIAGRLNWQRPLPRVRGRTRDR